MSSIRVALGRLDQAVCKLEVSLADAMNNKQGFVPYGEDNNGRDNGGNVVDVDFLSKRIDKAIDSVELLLKEGS